MEDSARGSPQALWGQILLRAEAYLDIPSWGLLLMPVSRPHTVLLVDDHPMTRAGLRSVIDAAPDLRVCGEAGGLAGALAAVDRLSPDLVLTDLGLERESGLDLAKQLRVWDPRPAVLVMSMHEPELYEARALGAGARGYLAKTGDSEEVLRAIRVVLRGGIYRSGGRPRRALPDDLVGLSDREVEVFLLISRGYAPRHIAGALGVSVSTVEAHRERLKQKLGIPDSASLLQFAVSWALDRVQVPLDPPRGLALGPGRGLTLGGVGGAG